jgi:hypothetical protein
MACTESGGKLARPSRDACVASAPELRAIGELRAVFPVAG